MRNQRGPISAASPRDKYVKHSRLQDVRFRDCVRLHSCDLKMCHDLCLGKQNWRHPHKQLQSDCHFSLYISKSVLRADFQCQCEFSYLTLVMCHLLIDSVKTSAFSHWLSSVHRWLTGQHSLAWILNVSLFMSGFQSLSITHLKQRVFLKKKKKKAKAQNVMRLQVNQQINCKWRAEFLGRTDCLSILSCSRNQVNARTLCGLYIPKDRFLWMIWKRSKYPFKNAAGSVQSIWRRTPEPLFFSPAPAPPARCVPNAVAVKQRESRVERGWFCMLA